MGELKALCDLSTDSAYTILCYPFILSKFVPLIPHMIALMLSPLKSIYRVKQGIVRLKSYQTINKTVSGQKYVLVYSHSVGEWN